MMIFLLIAFSEREWGVIAPQVQFINSGGGQESLDVIEGLLPYVGELTQEKWCSILRSFPQSYNYVLLKLLT